MNTDATTTTDDVLAELDAARARREAALATLDEANSELDEAVVRAYQSRHTWNTLVERAGLSMPTIRQRLIKAGALTPRTNRP